MFGGCEQDPARTGGRLTKETIILEPTSPTTHFVFKPAARDTVRTEAVAAAARGAVDFGTGGGGGGDGDEMRLDRFKHVPGCVVCRGSLGHVKV